MGQKIPKLRKRSAQLNPQNRFEAISVETDLEDLEWDESLRLESINVKTQLLTDNSKSIITKNNSPDVGFTFSVNPYRGCEHGCSYCYARPTHETLGLNAGVDFESKIMVKHHAATLLRASLSKKNWQPERRKL